MKKEDFIRKMNALESEIDCELLNSFKNYVTTNFTHFEDSVAVSSGFALFEVVDPEEELRIQLEKAKNEDTFSDALRRLVIKSNMLPSEIYRAAGIDCRHYSKIMSNRDYKTTKETVVAFAIALKLNLDETTKLLSKAGFGFSDSNLFDIAIEFFIKNQIYDRKIIDDIMEKLSISTLPQNW